MHGHKAKLLHARRYSEKVEMKKRIREHEKKDVKTKSSSGDDGAGALPTYLLDREKENKAKALSSALKEKRKEKAGKYSVPLPKVRGLAEDEVFKVMKTGKRKQKAWKRMVTKGPHFSLVEKICRSDGSLLITTPLLLFFFFLFMSFTSLSISLSLRQLPLSLRTSHGNRSRWSGL
jgi:hypothetical protein